MPIINGRRVDKDYMSGEEIIREANPATGRRTVIRKGMNAYTVDRYKQYSERDLRDKQGRPVRIETIPDRTKGSVMKGCKV